VNAATATVYTYSLYQNIISCSAIYWYLILRLLLHDTMLKDDSFRSGTSTSLFVIVVYREKLQNIFSCTVLYTSINYNSSTRLKRINTYLLHTVCLYCLIMNISVNIVWLLSKTSYSSFYLTSSVQCNRHSRFHHEDFTTESSDMN